MGDRLALLHSLRDAIGRVAGGTRVGDAVASVPTGLREVDAALGGFPRGRVAELVGAWSSGKARLALAAAARAIADGGLVAWIDPRRELCPPIAAAHGVALGKLLVVRPPATAGAIARAVEILGDGRAFALVVVDVPAGLRIEGTPAARLRAAAMAGGAAVVLLGEAPVAHGVTTLRARVGGGEVAVEKGGAGPGARGRVGGRAERSFWGEDAEQLALALPAIKAVRR